MTPDDVTLGDAARKACERTGVSERDVKVARAGSVSTAESAKWLQVYGQLPDGRRARMMCAIHMPHHVASWRPLQDDQ